MILAGCAVFFCNALWTSATMFAASLARMRFSSGPLTPPCLIMVTSVEDVAPVADDFGYVCLDKGKG